METIIKFGSVEYKAKANAFTAMIYKNAFETDILQDTWEALGGLQNLLDLQGKTEKEMVKGLIKEIDTVKVYQLVWAFIKTADKQTLPFEHFLEANDYVSLVDLIHDENFIKLLTGNVQRKK